jgi:hypothetical protein
MKKLIVIAVLTIGLSTFAQKPAKNPRKENVEQFTPQQRNELRLKTLTLDLGLNAAQQKEIGKIITEMDAKREAFKTASLAKKEARAKPTNDELFALRIKLLDDKIATKERLKKILDAKQFEKWEQMQSKNMEKNRKNAKKKMDRGSAEK